MGSDLKLITTGEWFPPYSNKSVFAKLLQSDEGLQVEADDDSQILASDPIAAVTISARIGSIPRRLTFSDQSVFETLDNDSIDDDIGHKSSRIYQLEKFRARIVVFTLAVFFLAIGIYRYALPILIEVAVWATPPVVPELMSSGTLKTLDQTVLSATELPEETRSKVSQDFNLLASHAAGGAGKYKLHFRSGGFIGPNAFALPDGSIVITDELIELADNDYDMITGVLGHEIGHVEYEHSLRQMYRAAGVAGLIMLLTGDVGQSVEDILTQGGGLLALSYSRDAETQADQRSVDLMREANKDPTALVRLFDILEKRYGDRGETSILSSHPASPERKKAILDYHAHHNDALQGAQ